MKKIIALILAIVLVLPLIPFNGIMAAESTVVLSDNHGVSTALLDVQNGWANPGETVEIDIVISENPGVLGAILTIGWADGLTLIADESGAAFSHMTYTSPSRYNSAGTNFVWFASSVDTPVDGTILTLTFTVTETATNNEILPIWVTCGEGDVVDVNDNDVDLTITDGYVRVITYKPGDSNGDGRVNSRDLVRLSQYISDGGKTDPDGYNAVITADACDVNGDGRINARDLIKLSQYISDGSSTNPDGYNAVLTPAKLPECKHTNVQATEAKAAECMVEGNIDYWYCADCAKYFSNAEATNEIAYIDTVISATGHTMVVDEAVAPSYTQTGLTEGSHCGVCGEVIVAQETIAMLQATYHAVIYRNLQGAESPTITQYAEHEGLAFEDVPAPVRSGYQFLGWYTASEGGTPVDMIKPGTFEDVTVFAHWLAIPYDIIYNKAGINSNKTTYTIEEEVILTTPEWSGLKFTGWSEPTGRLEFYENQAGETVARIPKGTTGRMEITANWTTYENLVNAKENGKLASVFDPETEKYYFLYDLGMIENVPLDQIFETYEKTTTGKHIMSISKTVTIETSRAQCIAQTLSNAVTQTEQWQETIGRLNSGTLGIDFDLSIGMDFGVDKMWTAKFDTTFGVSSSFTAQSTHETTESKVVDKSTGLEKEYSSTLAYAETLSTTTDTSMEISGSMPNGTYAFVHAGDIRVFAAITYDPITDWYYMNTYSILDNMHAIMLYYADKSTMYDSPCGGLTAVVPVEEIKTIVESSYYVQYNKNGGEGTMQLSIFTNGENGILSENKFTRQGYTFDYWELVKADGSIVVYRDKDQVCDIVAGGETIELIAKWKPNTYTVTYESAEATDGTTSSSIHTYDSEKALTENKFVRQYTVTYEYAGNGMTSTTEIAKYTFAGWLAESGTVYQDKEPVLNLKSENEATTTMKAIWASTSVILPTPTRTGYTFVGWYEQGYTKKVGEAGDLYTPEGDITLYALWQVNVYKVTYDYNGGTGADEYAMKTYDELYGDLPVPDRGANYEFLWWTLNGTPITDKTTVTTDSEHTLVAQWLKVKTVVGYYSREIGPLVGDKAYQEAFYPDMDRDLLKQRDYGALMLTITVDGWGEWGIQVYDEPYIKIYSYTDQLLKKISLGGYPAGKGNWERHTVVYMISLDDVQWDGSFWIKYGNDKSNDEWTLGTTEIKIEAIKYAK